MRTNLMNKKQEIVIHRSVPLPRLMNVSTYTWSGLCYCRESTVANLHIPSVGSNETFTTNLYIEKQQNTDKRRTEYSQEYQHRQLRITNAYVKIISDRFVQKLFVFQTERLCGLQQRVGKPN